ncbi:hypothetical protein ADICYQ_1226 [Cyclobacterium qasimii M12-11B]|uniref:Uncharacterized protein n=1 Tax=Cyclobacterium qasimii M12-11B TaxID=641524 RepID=S7X112_9BACT|nr:hypothetical protein ADICYQ_1226 [Cyclobacterium qasimii M12-11B]
MDSMNVKRDKDTVKIEYFKNMILFDSCSLWTKAQRKLKTVRLKNRRFYCVYTLFVTLKLL